MANAGTARCAFCGSYEPRSSMHAQQVLKGFQGRKRNGVVMVCSSCKSGAGQGGQNYQDHQSGMMVACVAFFLVAIPLAIWVISVRGH